MAESRYGEQQKELLAVLGEAELALREKDPSSVSSYPPFAESLHNPMSSLPLKPVLADPKQSTDHFFSDYVRQSTQVPTRPKLNESSRHDSQDLNQFPVHMPRSDGASNLSNAVLQVSAFTVASKDCRENSHDEDRVQGRVGPRGDDSNCGTCSSPPSTIIGEGDSVLGDINKVLYTPSAHHYPLSRNAVSERVLVSSTPSFLSTPYASPLGDSLERSHYNPLGGSGVYSEKVLAGDERHVSVALRAYAMSVAEEEKKSWHSPLNMKNYPHQTFSVSTLRGAGDPSVIRPVRMFTEDEIVSKSQSPDGA